MTDPHHGHKAFIGGHEIDVPPTRELFNIIWGLSALTLLSLITCVQLFNDQARDISAERGSEGSALLAEYRKSMETRTRGAGEDTITDANGKIVARYNYIPLASARDLILAKPEKLGAFAPPPGWMHPDDIAAGGGGAVPPVPPPAAPTEPAAPAGEPAAEPAPAGEAPATEPPTVPEGAPGHERYAPRDEPAEQRPSARPVPGGMPEPVGSKTHPVDDPAAIPGLPPTADGHPAPEGTPKAQPVPVADQHPPAAK